jgi:integrase
VATAKPDPKRKALVLSDGGGLYLQCTVGKDGGVNRSWTFRCQLDDKRHERGLGPTYTISITQARAKAKALREQLLEGVAPLTKKAARQARLAEAAKTVSFAKCTEMYVGLHQAGWTPRHLHDWRASMAAYALPKLGPLAVADITEAHVMAVVQPFWTTKPVTAGRVLNRIRVVLDFAAASGFRNGGNNPAGAITAALPKKAKISKVKHLAAPPWQDVPQLMAELRGIDSTVARALEFAILCAVRSGEVLGATHSEVKDGVWTIPSHRMKAGGEHRIPLSKRAREILAKEPKNGPYIFQRGDGRPLAAVAMRQGVLQKLRPGMTVHGTARACFKTWASESTAFPRDVVEVALAHKRGNQSEQAYERGSLFDKRARLMDAWADFCTKGVTQEARGQSRRRRSATVTPIRGARRA